MSSAAATAVAAAFSRTPLQLHRSVQSMRALRKSLDISTRVGFVPTMGALHEGHLSLVREARDQNDVVVTSIFVNPTQFGPNEDFERYPRQLERDAELLADLGVDHLFCPSHMYNDRHVTYVEPQGFNNTSEGMQRPGHFRGVATIVTKLFNVVQPTHAYFGQKDAAQCCVIRQIVNDLDMDVDVVVMDTVREVDGLAMSSRNAYLTPEERRVAPILFRSLAAAQHLWQTQNKDVSAEHLRETVQAVLQTAEPVLKEIQYISIDDKWTMTPIEHVGPEGAVISLACQVGGVRLIDNIVLK